MWLYCRGGDLDAVRVYRGGAELPANVFGGGRDTKRARGGGEGKGEETRRGREEEERGKENEEGLTRGRGRGRERNRRRRRAWRIGRIMKSQRGRYCAG